MELGLFFDTETTGKPLDWKAPLQRLDNWPRVTQLAWQVADLNTGQVIVQRNHLIKPDGWIIPNEADFLAKGYTPEMAKSESKFFVDNNMTTERCEAEGLPMEQVLDDFIADYDRSLVLVAHNMSFDHNVAGAELMRYKKRASKIIAKVCTMQRSTDVCQLKGKYKGAYKWPSLVEAHVFFTGKGFEGNHDADPDVTACRVVFFELLKRGHINPAIWRA